MHSKTGGGGGTRKWDFFLSLSICFTLSMIFFFFFWGGATRNLWKGHIPLSVPPPPVIYAPANTECVCTSYSNSHCSRYMHIIYSAFIMKFQRITKIVKNLTITQSFWMTYRSWTDTWAYRSQTGTVGSWPTLAMAGGTLVSYHLFCLFPTVPHREIFVVHKKILSIPYSPTYRNLCC